MLNELDMVFIATVLFIVGFFCGLFTTIYFFKVVRKELKEFDETFKETYDEINLLK